MNKEELITKSSNPKLERIKKILKYSKALEKMILSYENELLINKINKDKITKDKINTNKRRGRPKKDKDNNKEDKVKIERQKKDKNNNKENYYDDNVKIDYTGNININSLCLGVSELMNGDIEI